MGYYLNPKFQLHIRVLCYFQTVQRKPHALLPAGHLHPVCRLNRLWRGGGGGAGSSATLAPFVKFSSIAVPGTTRINGSSQEADYTFDTVSEKVTSLSPITPSQSGASYIGTIDANGETTKAVLTSAAGTRINVDTANGGSFGYIAAVPVIAVAVTANDQDFVLSAIPQAIGWDYQTFGVWTTGGGTGSGTVGVASVGAETAGTAIPKGGIAVFEGGSGGRYVDSAGSPVFVLSDMTATADFDARSIAFATTDSMTTPDMVSFTSNGNLNTSGTLTYSAEVNQFTGAVTTVGGGASNAPMTGTATGKFYGPSAQEIGGTFAVSGGGFIGYLGAFGGKR